MACFSKRGYAVRSEGNTRPPPSLLNGIIARVDVHSERESGEQWNVIALVPNVRHALEGNMVKRTTAMLARRLVDILG